MSLIIGIDLGTTFSAVGLVRDGKPEIVPVGDEAIMPSVVGLGPDGNLLVGTPARNQYVLYPERTVRSIKRQMGEATTVRLGERDYTPPQISALILRELRRAAEAKLGEPIERAVITVPAYFTDAARQATREAGEIAGFVVERIINEPTAAALAYGLDRSDERQLVAVYDLGGGTFDVSIIELDNGVVEVRASHGNTQLGGDDFDERLREILVAHFEAAHGVSPRDDRRAMARLLRAAENAKITLSSRPTAHVQEEYLLTVEGRPLNLDVEVQRDEFETAISDLLDGTIEALEAALKDASITIDDLDKVLFVGGSTRIPLVWEMVREHTGIEPAVAINPDEAVALGAAVQGAIIGGEPLDAILVDVTPHSLGIEVAEFDLQGRPIPDHYSVIIPRNTTVPTTRADTYHCLYPSQSIINLKIYQGEHAIASRNTLLGEFRFDELKPEAVGVPPSIVVQFDFDMNGIVNVSAVDKGSGKKVQTTVRASHVLLTPAEIAGARVSLEQLEQFGWGEGAIDMSVEAVASPALQLSTETLALLARAQRALESHPGHQGLLDAIANVENAASAGNQDGVEQASEALIDLLYDLED
ncbi:MAG: heat-shock protein Hsp70 [Candidatus Viridilinea halotolerans]|uniref:Heat-shock protein Hsp70 n=1 Tax=Candidatus Viridilinea halotolerans TaxID=2491704 RepID=A0A426TYN8_9CHLR|nr:MAG: heat-shock protein Hsp70 [Candidatus Viridilinea halotolerans]